MPKLEFMFIKTLCPNGFVPSIEALNFGGGGGGGGGEGGSDQGRCEWRSEVFVQKKWGGGRGSGPEGGGLG